MLHPHPCFLSSTFTPRNLAKHRSFPSTITTQNTSSSKTWRCSSSLQNSSRFRNYWSGANSDNFRERRSDFPRANTPRGFREREADFEPRHRRNDFEQRDRRSDFDEPRDRRNDFDEPRDRRNNFDEPPDRRNDFDGPRDRRNDVDERRFERYQRPRGGRFERGERRGGYSQQFRRERNDRFTRWNGGPRERHSSNEKSGPLSIVQKALAAEEDQLLYGINPVYLALLSEKRTRFEMLFVQDRREEHGESTRKNKNEIAWKKIMDLAREKEIPIEKLSKGDLNSLCKNRPHQGVVLQASPLEFMEMTYLPPVTTESVNESGRPFCYLVLDQVYDPQNAGALLRSAHFLGADGVIVCQKNSCPLSEVVSKASAGAVELTDVWGVKSMPRFLKKAREDGWRVIGTDLGEDSVGLREVNLDSPTLLVLGSEGHGLRTLVKKECNVMVRIGGSRNGVAGDLGLAEEPVDSLNVSVAGAVALFQLLGK